MRHRNRGASTERNAVLPTIAILMVGCFVICSAVLVLATATDGRRKASVLLARTGTSGRGLPALRRP